MDIGASASKGPKHTVKARIETWRDVTRTETAFFRTKDKHLRPAALKRKPNECFIRLPKEGDKSLVHTHIYDRKKPLSEQREICRESFDDLIMFTAWQALKTKISYFHIAVVDKESGNLMGTVSYLVRQPLRNSVDKLVKQGSTIEGIKYSCRLCGIDVENSFRIRHVPAEGYMFHKEARIFRPTKESQQTPAKP